MNRFLCETTTSTGTIIIYVVLIVVLVAMLIMPYFSQKKRNKEFASMLDSIRVGDLVKTAGGIIGKVTKITDKGDIKTVILETGSKSEKSYMEFDMTMIYCVLKSTKADSSESDKKDGFETIVVGDDESEKVDEVSVNSENIENESASTELAENETEQNETAEELSQNAEAKTEEPAKKTRATKSKTTSKKASAKTSTKKK